MGTLTRWVILILVICLINPAVGAVGFVNILLLPLITVVAVLLLFLNIKFTKFVPDDEDICERDAVVLVKPEGANDKLPE